jgi:hypothetical protein
MASEFLVILVQLSHMKACSIQFKNVYPLCLFFSGDEVQLNKKGSLGCKPWYMSIANVRGHLNTSPRNIECLGYSPDWMHTKVSVMTNSRAIVVL